MKKTPNKRKTTTISCDEQARQFIAKEAERSGRLQRDVLNEMIAVYVRYQERNVAKQKEQDIRKKNALELFQDIKATLDKNIKRDDQAIAFIKTQESKILSPMSQKIDKCEDLLNTIIGILSAM